MAKKRTFREFKQGIYKPTHKEKCINKDPVVYRSGLELSLMHILDNNPNVLEWASETGVCIIPYIKPTTAKPARYFVDFYIKLKIGDIVRELLVEVKPFKQTQPVSIHGNVKRSTILYAQMEWAINQAKWEAAKKWCEKEQQKKRDINFVVLTEKNINSLGSVV